MFNPSQKLIFVACLFFSFFSACATTPKKSSESKTKPALTIALLPFENQAMNLNAADIVRQALFKELKIKGYELLEIGKIDSALKELGISDGGQLGSVSIEKLREKILADLFCYGTVLEFGLKSAVAFSQRKVQIKLKIIDSKTGKIYFEGEEIGITSRAGTDAAGDLVVHAAGKVVKSVKQGAKKLLPGETLKKTADLTDEIADVDLKVETQEAVQKLLNKFPK